MSARYALYWAPEADDPLHHAGSAWLGRDALSGTDLVQPDVPDLPAITRDARGYGFHATLKPPMRLPANRTESELREAAADVCAGIPEFALPPVAVVDLHGFVAVCDAPPAPRLQALADRLVAGLDGFRAPPDEAEVARRRKSGLTARQEALLARWGYPYVFEEWRFHMTLSSRLNGAAHGAVLAAARAHFAAPLAQPRTVRDVALFVQPEPGAPFTQAVRFPLRS